MISDAFVRVTCDGDGCSAGYRGGPAEVEVELELEYTYNTYSGKSGQYVGDDTEVEEKLEQDHDWRCADGKHYCPHCAEALGGVQSVPNE